MAVGASREQQATEPLGRGFNLFAECVLLGVLVTVASLPLVTWFAAFTAAGTSLRRYLRGGTGVGPRPFLRDLRAGLPGTLWAGLAGLAVVTFLGIDLAVAAAGVPGRPAVVAVLVAGALASAVVLLRTSACWRVGDAWWPQLLAGARRSGADPSGSLLLAGGVILVAVSTWQLLPLLVPALGCLAMAATAVEQRAGSRRA